MAKKPATMKEPAQKNPVHTLDPVKILFETLHNPLLGVPASRLARAVVYPMPASKQ